MKVEKKGNWLDRTRAMWAKFLRRLRPRVGVRIDLIRYRLHLRRRARLRASPATPAPRFFFATASVPALCAIWRKRLPEEANAATEKAEQISRHRFDLLGFQKVNVGAKIDWHFDPVHGLPESRKPWFKLAPLQTGRNFPAGADRKIVSALNRHQHWVTLAKVYRLTGDGRFATEVFCQWRQWHAANPYPMGVNWARGREVALRSLCWSWLYFLLADSPQLPPGFRSQWLQAMAVSGRHLDRYALAFTSEREAVLAEGAGLFFIGVLCPELDEAEHWKKRGWEVVLREAKRQFGHGEEGDGPGGKTGLETSTSDYVNRLDLFLHASILASLNHVEVPREFEQTLERMLEALCLLGRSGAPPCLGACEGIRVFDPRRTQPEHWLDPLATGAILFGRGDFKHVAGEFREESLWLLGEEGLAQFDRLHSHFPRDGAVALPEMGLYFMASAEQERQLIIDARPQNAVQAHQGQAVFSVSLNCGGRALLIDPGISDGENAGCPLAVPQAGRALQAIPTRSGLERRSMPRAAQRNSLLVGPRGSTRPAGRREGEQPRSQVEKWIGGRSFDLFVGSDDGYGSREFPLLHRRCVFSFRSEFWVVRDLLLGEGGREFAFLWHLSPELSRYDPATGIFSEDGRASGLQISAAEGHGWSQEVRQAWWSPVYGRREQLHVLQFSTSAAPPVEFVTLLAPVADRAVRPGGLTPLRQSPSRGLVSAYRYATAAADHNFYFGQGKAWTMGMWASDAELLYWSSTPDGDRRTLICCNASYVEADGQRVISGLKPILRGEVVINGEQMDVFSSDPDLEVNRQALDQALPRTALVLNRVRPRTAKRASGGRS